MQNDYKSSYLDPSCPNFSRYPVSEAAESQASIALDDIAVTTGQASFDEGDGDTDLNPWGTTLIQGYESSDFGYNGAIDPSSTQAQSAPATAWGHEGPYNKVMFGGDVSSWTNDAGPWDPLRPTFANPVSGYDPSSPSRQGYQAEASPQWPSDLVAPRHPRTSTIRTSQQHQTFAEDQGIQHDSHFVGSEHSPGQAIGFEDVMISPSQPQSIQYSGLGNAKQRQQDYPASSTSPSSSIIPSPNPEDDDSPSYSMYSQGTSTRHHRNLSERSQPQLVWPPLNPIEEMDGVAPQHRIGESRTAWQSDDPNFLSPYGQTWQQHNSLNSAGTQFQIGQGASSWTSDLERTTITQSKDTASQCDSTYGDNAEYGYQQERFHLDHPKAILIPTSSKRYESTQPSSFPVTQGFYPRDLPPGLVDQPGQFSQEPRPCGNTISTPMASSQPMQRNTSGSKSARRSRTGSLSIIREDGQTAMALSASPGSQKGRRSRPLDPEAREGARQKRIEKTVCIRCRMMKQTCKGGIPCNGCRDNLKAKSWCQQCVLADFTSIVKAGTFNHIFHHRASHLTLDGSRRRTLHYSGSFDVTGLLRRLQYCRDKYNIVVRHWSGSIYTLDLAACLKVLSTSKKMPESGICELDDFAQDRLLNEWLACIKDHHPVDPTADSLSQSINLNNMPSRNMYHVLHLNSKQPARALDIDNNNDREFILFAISLSRIVLRALELRLFQSLQKELNELPKSSKSDADVAVLLRQIGQLLINLRWRISWWTTFGACSDHEAHSGDSFTERATNLAHVLYCYFFVVKKKSWSGANTTQQPVVSTYPDADPVEEYLPEVDTIQGFHDWLDQGHELIRPVQQHLAHHD